MIYRVIIFVGYHEAWFDFDDIDDAGAFARIILAHQTTNEDTKKPVKITIQVINIDAEEESEDE